MLKKFIYFILGAIFMTASVAYAAPVIQNFTNIQPFITDTYSNGSTTLRWLNFFTKNASTTALSITGQANGCAQFANNGALTSTGVNCGSGSASTFGTTSISATSPLSWNTATAVMSFLFNTVNTWTGLNTFSSGIMSTASSTIGNGTQAGGLTINGSATTSALQVGPIFASQGTGTTGQINASGNVYASGGFLIPGLTSLTTGILYSTANPFKIDGYNGSVQTTAFSIINNYSSGIMASLPLGFLSTASSTIGNGTQTGGLTISGGATTTGTAYFGGNVGIGTTSPQAILHIQNDATEQVRVEKTSNASTRFLLGRVIGVNAFSAGYDLTTSNVYSGSIDSRPYSLRTNDADRLTITNTGLVGISTTSPSLSLVVQGQGWFYTTASPGLQVGDGSTGSIKLGDSLFASKGAGSYINWQSNGFTNVAGAAIGYGNVTDTNTAFKVKANTIDSLVIPNATGNVGLGTTTPSSRLTVSVGNVDGIRVDSSNSGYLEVGKTGGTRWRFANEFNGANSLELLFGTSGTVPSVSLMAFNANGNVGISSTSPGSVFSIGNIANFTAATSTLYATGGINLTSGCFAVGGVCIGVGAGSGTVTSIATNNGITGGTITTSGTIGLAAIAANSVLGNITGSSGVPSAIATSSLFQNASATLSGLLTSTDWNTFNNKQATLSLTTTGSSGAATLVGTTLNIPQYAGTTYTATYPVTLTGSTFGLAFGTSTSNTWGGTQTFTNAIVNGTLTGLVSANNGQTYASATSTLTPSSPLTGSFTQVGTGGSIGCTTAASGVAGCLSATAFDTFNNKVGTSRQVLTTYPVTGGGDLSADRTIALAFGTTTTNIWSNLQTFTNGFISNASSTFVSNLVIASTANPGVQIGDNSSGYLKIGDSTISKAGGSLWSIPGINLGTAGNAGVVGLSFGTINTGLFGSSNTINFSISGAEKGRFDSTGNFGIGTTSPWGMLSLNPNGITGPAFVIGSSTSANGAYFIVTNGGNVGIQNSTPSSSLDIGTGDIRIQNGRLNLSNVGNTNEYLYSPASSGVNYLSSRNQTVIMGDNDSNGNGSINFKTRDNTADSTTGLRMIINNTGLVGIGTSSPFAKLSVHANNGETNQTLFAIGSSTASATTTLFSISNTGALTQLGGATSTFSNGLNLTSGCFSIAGVCVGGGSGSSASTTLLADANTFSGLNKFTNTGTTTFTGPIAIGGWEIATSTTVCLYPNSCHFQANANSADVAINAAITYLQGAGGGVVDIQRGTYTLNAPLLIANDGIILQGQGNNATIIILKNSFNDYAIKVNDAALRSRLEFRQFKIDGNRANQTSGGCIMASSTARSTFDTMWLEGCYQDAIKLSGPSGGGFGYNNTISNNYIANTINGIEMVNNDENQIYGNTINSFITYGIYDRQGLQNIHDNVFTGVVYATGVAVYSEYTVNTQIHNNTFDSVPFQSIYLLCNSSQGQHQVSNNYIYRGANAGTGKASITVDGCTRNQFNDNYEDSTGLNNFGYQELNNAPTATSFSNNTFFGTTSAISFIGTGNASTTAFWNTSSATPPNGIYWAKVDNTGQIGFNTPTGYGYNFGSNGVNLLSIRSGGNVGIGTSTPSSKLSVQSPTGVINVMIAGLIGAVQYVFHEIDQYGHVITGGPVPTVGTCGTTPTIAGNDTNFRVLAGTGVITACTVTFANAYPKAPVCNVQQETGTGFAVIASSTPTGVVISGATLTSDFFVGHCEGIF